MIGSPAYFPHDIERAVMPAAADPKVALAASIPQSTSFSMIVERSIPSALPPQMMVQSRSAAIIDELSDQINGAARSFAESSLFNTRATAANMELPTPGAMPPHSALARLASEPRIALHEGRESAGGIQTPVLPISARSAGIRGRTPPTITPGTLPSPRALNSRADAHSVRTLRSQPAARSAPQPNKRLAQTQRDLSPIHIAIAAIKNGIMIAARVDRASPDCADRLAQEAAAIADELGVDIAAVTVNGHDRSAQMPGKR